MSTWGRKCDGLQRCLVEAGANVSGIDPAILRSVAYRKHQGAKVLSRSAGRSVTDDYDLLLMYSLEFEPLARSLARVVEPRRAFSDYVLLVCSLRLGELPFAKLGDVLAVVQQRIARQKSFQDLLALKQWLLTDVFAAHE